MFANPLNRCLVPFLPFAGPEAMPVILQQENYNCWLTGRPFALGYTATGTIGLRPTRFNTWV